MKSTDKSCKELQNLLLNAEKLHFEQGECISRPDIFPEKVFYIKSGIVRVLTMSLEGKGPITIHKLNTGDWIGLTNLIFGKPCEWTSATDNVEVLALDAPDTAQKIWSNNSLLDEILSQYHPAMITEAVKSWIVKWPSRPKSPDSFIFNILNDKSTRLDKCQESQHLENRVRIICNHSGITNKTGDCLDKEWTIGSVDSNIRNIPLILSFNAQLIRSNARVNKPKTTFKENQFSPNNDNSIVSPDAYTLGIRTYEKAELSERFIELKAKRGIDSRVAVMEMIAKSTNTPFKKDQVRKSFRIFAERNKPLNIQLLAQCCTMMGLDSRPISIRLPDIRKVRPPFLLIHNSEPLVVYEIRGSKAVCGDGISKLTTISIEELSDESNRLNFVKVQKSEHTASDRFSWNWVWSIVKNYRRSLLLVIVISLVAQLFSLGTPLLLQQLIDKVLSQGNLSSLNSLAALMIIFALFSSILSALRQFLFVDTTDRIDLTFGSSIINRMLQLKLSFFEQRPVGELSQRIGEMNTIRGFLTGTAITTFLDLVFSTIYLMVMLSYSPSLTAIALSTFPVYLIITFFVAPLYRDLLRKRANAQALTQAHLIETLGGIQTVKAQHGELRARWKWQTRYQNFVEQGYKSTVVGTITGQIGSFLNTLSGLLILWAGLAMVLRGEFTLGQLLAFRIFAGYVTGPLLRISNLWQGIQKVNISMERLGDVVNQPTEAGEFDDEQISLPPITGNVAFERVSFSFPTSKELQLKDISLEINSGEFVGIVGLSGSGKSTLMKLLARLYPPNEGRVLIDETDINKVQLNSLRSQIGLVPQDSTLFEGSISDNIAMNDPNIDSEEIVQAAKLACAHDFIMNLPQGYATRVSEKGANFSGGQRQRIAIARMILEKPSLLIMDEATSALDADTERRVSRNLMDIMKGKTVLFVTHRLATVMRADKIVVMDQGQVAEVGSPKDLIDKRGIFSTLWDQQS